MNTNENPMLHVAVRKDTPLKEMIVDYVGNRFSTLEDEGTYFVTVQMVAETLAEEFPEFLMVMAEENWVRGYQQGLDDAELRVTKTEADSGTAE
jgi:hypothetical protein